MELSLWSYSIRCFSHYNRGGSHCHRQTTVLATLAEGLFTIGGDPHRKRETKPTQPIVQQGTQTSPSLIATGSFELPKLPPVNTSQVLKTSIVDKISKRRPETPLQTGGTILASPSPLRYGAPSELPPQPNHRPPTPPHSTLSSKTGSRMSLNKPEDAGTETQSMASTTNEICLGECLGEQTQYEDDATLFVCTKCSRKNIANACTSPFSCRLLAQGEELVDMEDLLGNFNGLESGMLTPDPGKRGKTKGSGLKTGQTLYYNLVKFQDDRWKAGLDIDGRPTEQTLLAMAEKSQAPAEMGSGHNGIEDEEVSILPSGITPPASEDDNPTHEPNDSSVWPLSSSSTRATKPSALRRVRRVVSRTSSSDATVTQTHPRRIKIQPVECLSVCDRANAIAFTAPGKYMYQFADIDHTDPEALHDIMQFAHDYIHSEDGFTKTKKRPQRLRKNITARIPPLTLPHF
ncbi:hypothetical protein IWQ61_000898 [Dispira simplex]|nr:hypothetical protein IWQ61_000898 [Dispira simplex]